MYSPSNLLLIERYSKKEGLSYQPDSGTWLYDGRSRPHQTLSTAQALSLLMDGSLDAGAGNIEELAYRNRFGATANTAQTGVNTYHIVIMIPHGAQRRFRDVYAMDQDWNETPISRLHPNRPEEFNRLIIPDYQLAQLLDYTAIYWGPGKGEEGERDLCELHVGRKARTILNTIAREGYESEPDGLFYRRK